MTGKSEDWCWCCEKKNVEGTCEMACPLSLRKKGRWVKVDVAVERLVEDLLPPFLCRRM